jgi:HK97 family phage portal protein
VTALDRYGTERLAELRHKAGLPDVRETRDPRAATQPLAYISPGHPMVNEWDAHTAIRWAFYANVIVYRCVQIIANTVSALPFRAGMAQPDRPGVAADHNPQAALARLLGPPPGGPAPKLSARRLWAWTVAQRLVTGRHGWEVETDGAGVPIALWPLTSASLRAVPSTSGADWFARFDYGPEHAPKRMQPDQIVYGWDPSMHDFRQPESPLQAARLDVSIAVMGDRYSYAFLKNDARPAAVVVTEAFDSDDSYSAFKSQFRAEYGGPDNAGKTAFIEATGEGGAQGAIDIKVLGLSQKDAQFMQTHVASLQRIAIALGVPWSKLDASGRTFDNASEEDRTWWESTLLPRLADLADEVNMQLAPRVGSEVGWFDTSGVKALQETPVVSAVGAPSLMHGAVATIDEARRMVGLPALPDGAGARFLSADEILLLTGRTVPAAPEPVELEAPVAGEVDDEPANAPAPTRQRDPEVQVLTAEQLEQRRARIWRTADSVVRVLETQWTRRWQALFARQAKATIARLEGKRGRQTVAEQRADPGGVFDPDHWRA